jgi:hypothetical protein
MKIEMNKLFLLFFVFLFHITAIAQHKHSVNMFYGYSYYFSNEPHLHYPYNYNLGAGYNLNLNKNLKFKIGAVYKTRNYVHNFYIYSPIGILKNSHFMFVRTVTVPQIKFIQQISEIDSKNSFFLSLGIETMMISKAIFKFQRQTLNYETLFEYEENITKSIKENKQIGVNLDIGFIFIKKLSNSFNVSIETNGKFHSENIWLNNGSGSFYFKDNPKFSIEANLGIEFLIK